MLQALVSIKVKNPFLNKLLKGVKDSRIVSELTDKSLNFFEIKHFFCVVNVLKK